MKFNMQNFPRVYAMERNLSIGAELDKQKSQ